MSLHSSWRFLAPLLLLGLLLQLSCRENSPTSSTANIIRYQPSFHTGDRFRYALYDISPSGTILQSTRRSSYWTVLATSATRKGRNGVTVLVDSTGTVRPDTLLYCVEPGGDVSLYGFLASIESLRSGTVLTPGWDRVATFSLGTRVQWLVGSLDASGAAPVYGELQDRLEYVNAVVNGESTVFPAYRVDFTGADVEGSMWFAENPACVPVSYVTFWMDTTGRGRWLEQVTREPQ